MISDKGNPLSLLEANRRLYSLFLIHRNHGYFTRLAPQAFSYWRKASILPKEEVQQANFKTFDQSLSSQLITVLRAFEKGRQPANTRIGAKRIHLVRTRGGNQKYRALRIDSGNFSWGSEGIARKVRVIGVSFHPSNNELFRTNTLTKSAVVQVDAAPFRQWYEAHYGQSLGRRRQAKAATTEKEKAEEVKKSKSVEKKQAARFSAQGKVEPLLERQFEAGRLYAVVSSRPGQSGRVDGYILEGEELVFYQKAIRK